MIPTVMFLDDSSHRHAVMKRNCIGVCSVAEAWDADEAIALLDTDQEFDLIMLDHDLEESKQGFILNDQKDGRYVASWMAEDGRHKLTPVIIHSLNEPARDMMEKILRDNGFEDVTQLPFAWTMIEKGPDGGIHFNPNKPKSSQDYC